MADRIKLGVIFGGRSGEHEVSLMSARSVLGVLDPQKYDVTQIGISHEGAWYHGQGSDQLDGASGPEAAHRGYHPA